MKRLNCNYQDIWLITRLTLATSERDMNQKGQNPGHLDLDGSPLAPPVEHAVSPGPGIILHPLQPFLCGGLSFYGVISYSNQTGFHDTSLQWGETHCGDTLGKQRTPLTVLSILP